MTDITNPATSATVSSSLLWNCLAWGLLAGLSAGVVFPLIFSLLPALFGLIASGLLYFSAGHRIKISKKLLLWMIALGILCFASTIWAYNPEGTLKRAVKVSALLLLSLPFIFVLKEMPDSARRILIRFLPLSLIAQGVIVIIELYYNFPLYRLISGLGDQVIPSHILNKHTATMVMLFPFGFYFALLGRRYILAVLLSVVTLILFFRTDSQAAQLAFLVGIMAYPACRFLLRLFTAGVFAFTVFLLAAMPFLSPIAFDKFADDIRENGQIMRQASMEMRLENYDFISRKIMEKPLTGFGMDSTRYMRFETEQKFHPSDMVMHPHNMALQVWIEFGALGVAFFSAFAIFLYGLIRNNNLRDRCLIMTVFCIATVFLMVSWSIWASWLTGLMLALAGLCLFSRNMPDQSDKTFSPSK